MYVCVCVCVCAYPWRDVREIDGINKVEHIVAQESLVLYRAITHYCFAHIPQTGVYSVYGLCERYVIVTAHTCACVTRAPQIGVYSVYTVCVRYTFFFGRQMCVRVCVCLCVDASTHYCFAHMPQTGVCSVYGLCV